MRRWSFTSGQVRTQPRARRSREARRRVGFTLIEVLVAASVGAAVSIAFIGLQLMVSKSYKSMLSMHQAVRYAKAATEKINTEIRLAVAPIQVRDGNGAAAPQGNRVEFSRFGETTVRRLELVSVDADFMTPWDNTLVYDPDVQVADNEVVVSRWLAPAVSAGAFSYANATTPLTVRMRVGDPIGDESVARTGVGSQAAEINITVGPRN